MAIKTTVKEKVYPKQITNKCNPYQSKEEVLKAKFVKEIGFGIKTPETAHENYVDKKCPFTSDITVRGRIFLGQVIKMKAEKTIVVAIKYLFYDQKYKRYARRNTKINVHLSPCWNGLVKVGDVVKCGETRPLSKTKASCVVAIHRKADDNSANVLRI
ncbi:ribosomal prt S11 [Enterospora canceri]|uniref:Ribosomal prt S11 n=1 Tax=Enterospora canceri TaxID=1081671 RepID=A0A1Y1S9L4_9MICR|nr:ribosomal prt S11 [Enterospora canceri]